MGHCHVSSAEVNRINYYLTNTAWCVLREWMGGLQVQAVDTPFRAVTPGQVREMLQTTHSILQCCIVCGIL